MLKICSNMKYINSTGPDQIPNKALKIAIKEKAVKLFSSCLRRGEFSKDRKIEISSNTKSVGRNFLLSNLVVGYFWKAPRKSNI